MDDELRIRRSIYVSIKSTFIALIPKVSTHISFSEFRPISLCNIVYKLIPKVIVEKIKGLLSIHISNEQFRFLTGRSIHDAITIAQECVHSIHTK